jgi:hypothetical protein
MTERQTFRAIVRGIGVWWAVYGVASYWYLLDRLVFRFPQNQYRYSRGHDFLDSSIMLAVGYLLIRKSDRIIRFAYGEESEPDRISN